MPKQLFRKYLPKPERMREHKSLHFLGELLADPNLWHINRRSLAGATFIGIFVGFLPMPLQMGLAAVLAVRFHCNLPLSVVLVWISNPLTWVPLWYSTYRVGAWMLGITPLSGHKLTMEEVFEQLLPLYLGSVTCGLIAATLSYFLIKIAWRLTVIRNWQMRAQRRARKEQRQAKKEARKEARQERRKERKLAARQDDR